MNINNLTSFSKDIEKMNYNKAFEYTKKVVSFIEDNNLNIEDYQSIKLFSYSLGLLDSNNKLLEEYHVILENEKPIESQILDEEVIYEDKLPVEIRNKLKDSDFGIPELRKYPLIDKIHVIKAIQFFGSCPKKYKKELKARILKKAKEFGVTAKSFKEAMENNNVETVLNEAPNNIKLLREQATKMIYEAISYVDKDGRNLKAYKKLYDGMSDEQFHRHMLEFLQDDNQNFYLEILPNKNEPSMKEIENLLDYLNIPENEYVWFRHDGDKDDPVRTKSRVPVGIEMVRRVQQILSKKNTYSLDIDKRDSKTG